VRDRDMLTLENNQKTTVSQSRHSPTLRTIQMIESTIKESDDYLLKAELLRKLPKKIMYPIFHDALEYLKRTNQIIYDNDNRIVWVSADNIKLKSLLRESIPV